MRKAALFMLLAIDLIWLKSSFGKVSTDKFLTGIAGTLKAFASKNPYPWYKDFLESLAIPNARLFGLMSMWGEVLVAVGLLVSLLSLILERKELKKVAVGLLAISLIGGIFLNVTFWLAAGWTSTSTESLNLLMALVEGVGLVCSFRLLKVHK